MGAYEELCERAAQLDQRVELHAQPGERDHQGVLVTDGRLTVLRLVGKYGTEIASARWQGDPDRTALALAQPA